MVWPLCPFKDQRKLIIVFKPSMEGGLVGVEITAQAWDGTTDYQVSSATVKGT